MAQRTEFSSFVSAIRAVLADADGPDMREVGRRAVRLLDDDLIFEAAATHLASMARREWNRTARTGAGADGDEVVVVGGGDRFLQTTSEADREWLASHRERLAEGLKDRADALRNWQQDDAADTAIISSRAVLRAERHAARLEALAEAMERITAGVGSGQSEVERRTATAVARAEERVAAGVKAYEFMMPLAKEVASAIWPGRDAQRVRRAASRIEPTFLDAGARIYEVTQ